MKVLLLTPPFIHNIKYPLLGIPCLSAFLKTKGHQVWQRDININYLDRIISNNQFYKILRNIQLMFNSLNDKDALTYFEQRDLITLSNYITKGSYLNKCLKVKFSKAQKDEKIPDWEAIIETVLKIVYAEAMGTSIGSYGKLIKRSIKDIIEIIKTRYNTFFGKYLTDYIEAEVNQLQPDVIGVSLLCSDQLAASLMIAETIKNKYPHIKVFLGGSYFTSIQKSISNDQAIFDFVDGVIVGEGEYPLSNILAKIQKNEPLTGIPNLFTKNSNAQNELFYGDINNYPEPDYDGIEFDKYTSPNTFPFYTSKGCAWNKCAFCATQEAGNYREKELKVVFDEITRLQEKYQIESIVFNEIIENNRIEAIARYLIDNSINIKWSCKTRFSKNMTESFFELVKRSNNSSITMELESGSSRILQDINKGVDNDTIDFVFKNCEKANHELSINLFTGFPTETKSEAEQTLYYPEKVFKQYPDLKIHFNTHFAKIERNSRFLKNGKKSSVKILANNNLLTTVDWIRPYWVKDVTFNSGKLIVNNRGDFSEEQQSYKLNDILFELKPEKKKSPEGMDADEVLRN